MKEVLQAFQDYAAEEGSPFAGKKWEIAEKKLKELRTIWQAEAAEAGYRAGVLSEQKSPEEIKKRTAELVAEARREERERIKNLPTPKSWNVQSWEEAKEEIIALLQSDKQ